MMEDKDWLKGLQGKMKDYEEPAPEGLWEDIESSVFYRERRRVITAPVLWRSVAVAAAMALGVFAGLRLIDSGSSVPTKESQEVLASVRSSSVVNDGSREPSVEIVGSPVRESLLAESRPAPKRMAKPVPEETASETSVEDMITEPSAPEPPLSDGYDSDAELVKIEEEKPMVKTPPAVTSDHDDEDWSDYISATGDSSNRKRKAATLDVSFSGAASDSRKRNSFDPLMFYRGASPTSASGLMGGSGGFIGNEDHLETRSLAPMYSMNSTAITSKSEHKRPVRFALMVSYPVSGTFSLEAGAMLTTLRSTFSSEAGRTLTETGQTLMYVGVPLNVTASLVDTRWFSLYLSGGGMAEKCVSGKSVTTETLAGIKQGNGAKKNLTVKPLLWSLNASAGLQANLTRNIGLYVEPGLNYHFDDKSDVQTIYKDKPFDFMLTFGARFSL